MDIITKIFLLNWLAVLVACAVDRKLLEDAVQKAAVIGALFGWWCVLTVFFSTSLACMANCNIITGGGNSA